MEYHTFEAFYPYYLSQHENQLCRRMHFIGTALGVLFFLAFLLSLNLFYLILSPIVSYGLAWIGHYFYEKNQPATFKYPVYSLIADFVMCKDMLTGKIPF